MTFWLFFLPVVMAEELSWNAARERCRERGGSLASLAGNTTTRLTWVGAARRVDGTFVWLDGSRVLYFCGGVAGGDCVAKFGDCHVPRDCGIHLPFSCDGDEPILEDLESIECGAIQCVVRNDEDCWELCAQGWDREPLNAATTTDDYCCCMGQCCLTEPENITEIPVVDTGDIVGIVDGLLTWCPESSGAEEDNKFRALAIFVIAMSLFCITAIIVFFRRACGAAFLPSTDNIPPVDATPASDRYPIHEDLTVEARHAVRSVVADTVHEVPVAHIMDDDDDDTPPLLGEAQDEHKTPETARADRGDDDMDLVVIGPTSSTASSDGDRKSTGGSHKTDLSDDDDEQKSERKIAVSLRRLCSTCCRGTDSSRDVEMSPPGPPRPMDLPRAVAIDDPFRLHYPDV